MRRSAVFCLLTVAIATTACRNSEPVDGTSVSPGVNPSESPTVESISPTSAANASESPSADASGRCTRAEGGEVQLEAQNLSFDTGCISISGNGTTRVELRNRDSTGHTFSVYDGNDEVLKGAVTDGGEDRTYRLAGLDPGTYRFQCDIHPSMEGTLRVS
jgi:plastocyanin